MSFPTIPGPFPKGLTPVVPQEMLRILGKLVYNFAQYSNSFKNVEMEGMIPISFYEVLTGTKAKGIIRKEKTFKKSLINIDANFLNKVSANVIEEYMKRIFLP